MESLIQYGALGIVCAAAIIDVHFLQNKMLTTIDNNTRALVELQKVVEYCQQSRQRQRIVELEGNQ